MVRIATIDANGKVLCVFGVKCLGIVPGSVLDTNLSEQEALRTSKNLMNSSQNHESSISALSTIGLICRIGWSSGTNWSVVIRVSIVT